jgi:very-short-patch-repair endonuclease
MYCDNRYTREDLIGHVEQVHSDMIPEGFTPFRLVFNYVNKKPLDYHGKCTECGGPTDWDENKGRYNRQCNKPACKASYIKHFEDNMERTKGVKRISSTAEGQEKMLANRKISGKYKFSNGAEKTYTGTYELNALKFMDKVMNINPDDLLCPGPVLEYEYNNQIHMYITDFFYIPYNLIIEVKDGGKNPNKRNMPEYRAKQIKKEEYIIKNTNYNYIRLTDNDLSQLLAVFADLKMQMVDGSKDRVIHVNEAMNALMSGYIPGFKDTGSVYVVNYMKHNTFTDEDEEGYGVTDNPKLTNLITRDKLGTLRKAPDNFLEDKSYEVFATDISIEEASEKLAPYMNQFVEEGFIYETLFGKELYTYDQIYTESRAYPIIDYYKSMEMFSEVCKNYFSGKSGTTLSISNESDISQIMENKSIVDYVSVNENLRLKVDKNNLADQRRFLAGLLVEV